MARPTPNTRVVLRKRREFIGHARQRVTIDYLLIGYSETRTASARLVLNTPEASERWGRLGRSPPQC